MTEAVMTKYITVDRDAIDRHPDACVPAIQVREGRTGTVRVAKEVIIQGPSRVVYDPQSPLPGGARAWIETEAELTLVTGGQ